MKYKGLFICFTGVDGSGKTTQAKKLVKNLEKNGIKFEYVYARSRPIIFKPFLVIANKIFIDKNHSKNYDKRTNEKKNALKNHGTLSKVFYKIMIFDYYIQLFYKIKIPLLMGRNIICDRYVYDTIITDISIDMSYSKDEIIKKINNALLVLNNPEIIYLMDINEITAYNRKDDVVSPDYIKDRRVNYLKIADTYSMIKINADMEIGEIESEILNKTLKNLEIL